ncbi:MAG: hypothetical protein WKF84_19435 [Pyrinomonadaceae bacterium]
MRPIEKLTFEAISQPLAIASLRDVERQEHAASYDYPVERWFDERVCDAVFSRPIVVGVSRADVEEASAVQLAVDVWRARQFLKNHSCAKGLMRYPQRACANCCQPLFEQVRRTGWCAEWLNGVSVMAAAAGAYYVMAVDGSDYFSSATIHCKNCLVRRRPRQASYSIVTLWSPRHWSKAGSD